MNDNIKNEAGNPSDKLNPQSTDDVNAKSDNNVDKESSEYDNLENGSSESENKTNGGDNLQEGADTHPELSIEAQLEQSKLEAKANFELYLRAKADMENIRRRAQEDVSRAHKFAIESFAENLLSVHDNLSRALAVKSEQVENLKEGVAMTLKQLDSVFSKFRIVSESPEKGSKLDPQKHQAVSAVPSTEIDANCVVDVMQPGFFIADRLLRPALVVVAQGKTTN